MFKPFIFSLIILFLSACQKKEMPEKKFLFIDKKITKNKFKAKKRKEKIQVNIPKDTTIVFYFKNLSYIFNYEIIDKFYNTRNLTYYDSVLRIIKIFDKKDSLIQRIYPKLIFYFPWYLGDTNNNIVVKSYITGVNKNYIGWDNYRGDLVIADLNFDGLEDFATPVSTGADNGPHYAFYIQNNQTKFEYNSYLTEYLVWFPDVIDTVGLKLTTFVPCCLTNLYCQTFMYDTILKKWTKIEEYTLENPK